MGYGLLVTIAGIAILFILISALAMYCISRRNAQESRIHLSAGPVAGSSYRAGNPPGPGLVLLKQEEMPPPDRSETFFDQSVPEKEDEQMYLYEEVVMSRRATDIIRKSNHLLRLHHLRMNPGQVPDRPLKKPDRQMHLSINPEELKREIYWKLEHERVYLNEELTIAAFAHELDIEPYQLSRFLNIHLHTTYTDLIGSYRVREAKELLMDAPEGSILDIAFSSGFNSKASFNRIFKRMTGMTPSEYRLTVKPGNADISKHL